MTTWEGRVALVTGASRGIGRATARTLAARGATVVAAARGDHAEAVAEEIQARAAIGRKRGRWTSPTRPRLSRPWRTSSGGMGGSISW